MATASNFLQELGIYPKNLGDYAPPNEPGMSEFIKMRRLDATVNAAMRSITRPILAAKFDIIPPTEEPSPEEIDIAKKLKQNIIDHRTFRKVLYGIVDDFLTKGSSINEIVLNKPRERSDGLRLIDNEGLRYRPRENIEEPPDSRDRNGKLRKLLQVNTIRRTVYPRHKLMICVNEPKGTQDWKGVSVLLGAFGAWHSKSILQAVYNGAAERYGFGIPYIKAPKPEDYQGKDDAYKLETDRLIQQLRKIQTGANSIVALPNSAEIGVLPFPGGNQNVLEGIKKLEKDIYSSILVNETEYNQVGSTNTQTKLFVEEGLKSVDSWAKDITNTFNDELIVRLVDLNWPGQERYPKMVVKNIQNNFIFNVLAFMAQSGLIGPTEELIRDIFESFGIDADPKKALEAIQKQVVQMNQQNKVNNNQGDNDAESNE